MTSLLYFERPLQGRPLLTPPPPLQICWSVVQEEQNWTLHWSTTGMWAWLEPHVGEATLPQRGAGYLCKLLINVRVITNTSPLKPLKPAGPGQLCALGSGTVGGLQQERWEKCQEGKAAVGCGCGDNERTRGWETLSALQTHNKLPIFTNGVTIHKQNNTFLHLECLPMNLPLREVKFVLRHKYNLKQTPFTLPNETFNPNYKAAFYFGL